MTRSNESRLDAVYGVRVTRRRRSSSWRAVEELRANELDGRAAESDGEGKTSGYL